MFSHALEMFRSGTESLALILWQSFQQTHTATSGSGNPYDPKIIQIDKTERDGQGPETMDTWEMGRWFVSKVWAIPKPSRILGRMPSLSLALPAGYRPHSAFTAKYCQRIVYSNGSPGEAPRPKASTLPGNLLERHTLGPTPDLTCQKSLRDRA